MYIYSWNCCSIHAALKFDVGGATDAQEASALGYRNYYIDVYSNSWGPSDFGFVVNGPDTLVQNTLRTGVTEVCGFTKNATTIPVTLSQDLHVCMLAG